MYNQSHQYRSRYALVSVIALAATRTFAQDAISLEASSPAVFIENQGQVTYQDASPASDVRYLFRSNGLNVILRDAGFSYELHTPRPDDALAHAGTKSSDRREPPTATRIDIDFEGASKAPIIRSDDADPYYENYYIAQRLDENTMVSREFTHVPSVHRVTYTDVWPGISIEFIASAGDGPAFKYNILAEAGADLARVRFRYAGAAPHLLDGVLRLAMEKGHLDEIIPASWCQREGRSLPANVTYVKDKSDASLVGFSWDAGTQVPPDGKLVIDPTPIFHWGRYVGGNSTDEGYDVVVSTSDIYVCGSTFSAGLGTGGTQQPNITPGTHSDAFLSKFTLAGAPSWTTYYGSTLSEDAKSLALDPQNNIFMVGMTDSNTGIAFGVGVDLSFDGVRDAFLAKFTPAGLRTWCAYFGGPNQEQAYSASAVGNDVFIAGNTYSPSGIAVGGSVHQSARQGARDVFVARISGAGQVMWASYYGGSGEEKDGAVATGPDGSAYLIGTTPSTNLITTVAWHPTLSGPFDGFLAKLNGSTGARSWGTYIGGNSTEWLADVAVNCAGHVYVVGRSNSASGLAAPPTVHQYTKGLGWDGFLARFSAAGVFNWASYYGGADDDYLYGVSIGGDARVFIGGSTGTTTGTAIATPTSSHPSFLGGISDGFLASFTSGGARNWGTYYGGEGNEHVYSVFQNGNRLYSTGRTYSNTIISTLNTEPGGPGLPDAFLGCHSADLTTTCGGGDGMWPGNEPGSVDVTQVRSTVMAWPNPTNVRATLLGAPKNGLRSVEVFDAQGRSCTPPQGVLSSSSTSAGVEVYVGDLNPGIYTLQLIYADQQALTVKLMVTP